MRNRLLPWLVAAGFALLFFSTLFTQKSPQVLLQPSTQTTPRAESSSSALQNSAAETRKENLAKRVIDGDTIELEDGTRVRYIGMDTPEVEQCFWEEATEENKRLVEGKKIKLENDVQKLDKYGRTLAYVFVDGIFVNEELVRGGFAKVYTYPPDVKYTEKFIAAQKEAREKKVGLWAEGICTSASPPLSVQGDPLNNHPTSECVIKGNISSSGEKIYHMPGQRYYEKTKIEEGKGERWFCSEDEAIAAGWRKSKI